MVSNVSIIQGKEKEFVAMPSYMVKQNGGKSQYQDVCFPVTKEYIGTNCKKYDFQSRGL